KLLIGLSLTQIGLGLVQRGLVRPGIDHEQKVPFIDPVASLEGDIVDISTDSRPDIHAFNSIGAASEFVPLDNLLLDWLGNRNWWRWRRRRWSRFVATRKRLAKNKNQNAR